MSASEIQHLVSMANDIGKNFSFHSDSAQRIADHLKRFWAPSMREMLLEFAKLGGEGLADNVLEALEILEA